MSKSKEYLALKNFFHNTMGLTRKEIREIVREVAKEMIVDQFRRFSETTEFQTIAQQGVKWALHDIQNNISHYVLTELIATRVKYEEYMAQKNLEKLGGPKATY